MVGTSTGWIFFTIFHESVLRTKVAKSWIMYVNNISYTGWPRKNGTQGYHPKVTKLLHFVYIEWDKCLIYDMACQFWSSDKNQVLHSHSPTPTLNTVKHPKPSDFCCRLTSWKCKGNSSLTIFITVVITNTSGINEIFTTIYSIWSPGVLGVQNIITKSICHVHSIVHGWLAYDLILWSCNFGNHQAMLMSQEVEPIPHPRG